MTVATAKLASPAQINFVKSLSADRDVPVAGRDEQEAFLIARWEDCYSGKDVSMPEASKVIDWLKAMPKKPVAVIANTGATVQLTEGVYEAPNGDIIKLQKSKSSGNLYAKVAVAITGERLTMTGDVVKFSYEYAPGLVKHITPAMRMNEAMAEAFAIRFGVCCWCGRGLKAAKSVKQGIGPVCIKRFA